MEKKIIVIRKIILTLLGAVLLALSGLSFYEHRHWKEPVIISDGVTEVKKLSTYFEDLAGTVNDCNLYFLEGEEEGGTIFILGGTHPEEPAGRLASWILTSAKKGDSTRVNTRSSSEPR